MIHLNLFWFFFLVIVDDSVQWTFADRKADVKAFLGQKTVQLTFGLILSKHDYKATLERGPEANSAAAGEFLSFWGKEASKLRRFPDGSMAEGVAWKAESEGERRVVCGQIIRHAMSRHAAIGKRSLLYVANLWDHVLQFQRQDHLFQKRL